jgi:hypothetical protein
VVADLLGHIFGDAQGTAVFGNPITSETCS